MKEEILVYQDSTITVCAIFLLYVDFLQESLICRQTRLTFHFLSTCTAELSLSLLNIQCFVTCNSSWHKSVPSCPVDWIIHRGSVGHTTHCYLTLPETLSRHRERRTTCVRVAWKGRAIKPHTTGDGECMEMNGLRRKNRWMKNEQRMDVKWSEEEK